jgi:hypothetical protein
MLPLEDILVLALRLRQQGFAVPAIAEQLHCSPAPERAGSPIKEYPDLFLLKFSGV